MKRGLLDKPQGDGYQVLIPEAGLPSTEVRAYVERDRSPSLNDFFEILVRRKWTVFFFLLMVLIPTLVVNLRTKPLYKAEGLIEMTPESPRVTKFQDMLASRIGGRSVEFFVTQIELLQSPALSRRVIERLELDKNPSFNPILADRMQEKGWIDKTIDFIIAAPSKLGSLVEGIFRSQDPPQVGGDPGTTFADLRRQKYMESIFFDNLTVDTKMDSSIIKISFDSTNPALAARVVNTLIDEFSGWQMDRRIEAAQTAKEQLDKQISLAKKEVEKSEKDILQYAKDKGIVSLDSKMNLIYQQLEKINDSLAKAEAERIQKEEMYHQAKEFDISTSPLVVQNDLVQSLRRQYIDLTGEYEKLRVFFKDDYPAVKNLKAKMLDIGKKIDAEQQRLLMSFKNEYLAASKVEKALQQTAEEKKLLALQLNEYAAQFKNLEREVDINKQIFQSLLERSKEIDVTVGTDLGNMKVVDLATPPLKPYKPKIFKNLLLAIVLGFVGGVGLALVRESLDKTVRRIDEISDNYLIPILGVLPLARKEEMKNLDSLVRLSPSSLFSEAIRASKASIRLALSNNSPCKTILVTGTASGEGKSTIVANLAQAYAGTDLKVLVIDADLRRPRLGHIFGMNGNFGLSHYLHGVCELDNLIQETAIPNLHFISSGPASSKLAELLASPRMVLLMESCAMEYDQILIDSPPFGVFADVMILGSQVDGVVLVTALGKTHVEDVGIFCRKLSEANARILGSIVNKLDVERYNGSYYRKQYRSYYARSQKGADDFDIRKDVLKTL